jgi:hypothetical protein
VIALDKPKSSLKLTSKEFMPKGKPKAGEGKPGGSDLSNITVNHAKMAEIK